MAKLIRILKCMLFVAFSITLFVTCSFTVTDSYRKIKRSDKPLNRNVDIIPDKYNTGADENTVFSTFTESGLLNGLYIDVRKDENNPSNNLYIITSYAKVKNYSLPNTVLIEDYDFSDRNFKVYNPERFDCKKKIIFRNCKFKGFANCGPYMDNKLSFEFEHCTFHGGVNEINISLDWCRICGFEGDGMNPLRDFYCTNCYICDLVPPGVIGQTHIDGFQIYGRKDCTNAGNIIFNNVRFEIPSIHYNGVSGAVNACVMFQLEYSDVNNCYFKNLICNGGGKWYPLYLSMGKTNKETGTYFKQENINLVNIDVSNNFGTIFYTGSYNEDAKVKNVEHLDKLYVSSVWKDSSGIHIICTNDTSIDKTLHVVAGTMLKSKDYYFDIPHCPSNWALGGEIDKKVNPTEALVDAKGKPYTEYTFDDMPFDIDCCISDNAGFVICYDGIDEIRNVKF